MARDLKLFVVDTGPLITLAVVEVSGARGGLDAPMRAAIRDLVTIGNRSSRA